MRNATRDAGGIASGDLPAGYGTAGLMTVTTSLPPDWWWSGPTTTMAGWPGLCSFDATSWSRHGFQRPGCVPSTARQTNHPISDDLRAQLEASWESIFVLNDREEPLYIQATVRELRADEVMRAIRIR